VARLAIAPAARADLRDIRIFSKAQFGAATAGSYMTGLHARFALVLGNPRAGRGEPDLGSGLRSIAYRSHRIYYQVADDGVLIVRILHQAQDVAPALGGSR
jgi:toxin ParE1/3/4